MPKNTVYVGRPTVWGNPFKIKKPFDKKILDYWSTVPMTVDAGELIATSAKDAVDLYEQVLVSHHGLDQVLYCVHATKELRGKNLACWCSLDKPCHADVLLIVANQ
jgi:hypothetical protein